MKLTITAAFKSLFILLLLSSCSSLPELILSEGNLSFLNDEDKLLVRYDFKNLKIPCCKSEEHFVDSIKTAINNEESGMGDRWAKLWYSERKEKFQAAFEVAAGKYLIKKGLRIDTSFTDAKYTMTVKIIEIEPGDVLGKKKDLPYICLDLIFSETNNTSNTIAKMQLDEVKGSLFSTTFAGSTQI